MRAIVQDRYGPPEVLHIVEEERPEPKDDEVLVRVAASTVTQTDTHIRAAHPVVWRLVAGVRKPRWPHLGVEYAGTVEKVGAAVTEFRAGDCVYGTQWFGIYAEYICVRERAAIAHMPATLTFEEAAAVPDGSSQGLDAVRTAKVEQGTRLVVYGASGSLGTAAVQLAKHLGAHVTGVTSTRNVELVRSIGADEVVDYTREDFTKLGEPYDAIIDAVGKYAFYWGRRGLKPGGIYVETDFGPHKLHTLVSVVTTRFRGTKRLKFSGGKKRKADLVFMKELIERGEYKPVIDRSYPMEQVAEAHRYVETWHKTGNVVLTISDG